MNEVTLNTLRTGAHLSSLGIGASQFGNLNRITTDEASMQAVTRAYDVGLRYFDTAPHYGLGLSELRLGAALHALDRDDVALSTKVGWQMAIRRLANLSRDMQHSSPTRASAPYA